MRAPSLRPQSRLSCSSLTGCDGVGVPAIHLTRPSSSLLRSGQGCCSSQAGCHSSQHISRLLKSSSCDCWRDQSVNGRDRWVNKIHHLWPTNAVSCSMSGYDVFENHHGPDSPEEEKIKGKLRFFFLNPLEKYWATRRLPWKLLLQILKILIVTVQLWLFAGRKLQS